MVRWNMAVVPANLERKYNQPGCRVTEMINGHLSMKTNSDVESLPLYLVAFQIFDAFSAGTNIWSLDGILKIGPLTWWKIGSCYRARGAFGPLFGCRIWGCILLKRHSTVPFLYQKNEAVISNPDKPPQRLWCFPLRHCANEVCVYAQGHQAVNSAALSVIINSLLWVHFSAGLGFGKFMGSNWGFMKVDSWVTSKC